MKKEFKDLSIEDRKEFLFLEGISISLPYTIAIIPFLVICLVTSSTYVGVSSAVATIILFVGYYIDIKKLKGLYGL